ncbi:MAG: hypothetical protein DRJ97_01995 [Thermoprotei archaeon]|nr:MAG: hypothetical protein DRJ97_01995 [Thermoprotei archaeon]
MDPYIAGATAAILASLNWSIAAVLYRRAVSSLRDPLATSGFRVPLALAFMVLLSFALNPSPPLITLESLAWVLLASTVGIVVGDALYMVALRDAGVSIGYPVGYVFPLYASLFAVLLLGESLTVGLVVGLALALSGIWLASFKPPKGLGDRRRVLMGVVAAVLAGVSWGLASVIFKVAVLKVDPSLVNLVKLLFLLCVMTPFMARSRGLVTRSFLIYALLGGLFGLGIGDWLLYVSLAFIGAARASTLTTSSPLISLILASVLLKEEVTFRQVGGALLIVAGILLAIAF